jgi:agmatinase
VRFASQALEGERFGILHFDAHMDLRAGYEGLNHSHASVMYNCFKDFENLKSITQVGVRDFCRDEWEFTQENRSNFFTFTDMENKKLLFRGESWAKRVKDIIETLPEKVWVSFDIDGLDPRFCPHTGTPVPGGLSYDQAVYLIRETRKSGRKILGFDLSEVSPSLEHTDLLRSSEPTQASEQWDGNVGARILFELCQAVI